MLYMYYSITFGFSFPLVVPTVHTVHKSSILILYSNHFLYAHLWPFYLEDLLQKLIVTHDNYNNYYLSSSLQVGGQVLQKGRNFCPCPVGTCQICCLQFSLLYTRRLLVHIATFCSNLSLIPTIRKLNISKLTNCLTAAVSYFCCWYHRGGILLLPEDQVELILHNTSK